MMQNLPFMITKPQSVKDATAAVSQQKPKAQEEKTSSFHAVLSKQIAEEKVQEAAVKTDVSKGGKVAVDMDDQFIPLDTLASEDVDPQSMAMAVTAKTVEEATDGQVVLDVAVEEQTESQNTNQLVATALNPNMTPATATATATANTNNVSELDVDGQEPRLSSKQELDVDTASKAKFQPLESDSTQPKMVLEKDGLQGKFADQMVIEKSMQQTPVTQAAASIVEAARAATAPLQVASVATNNIAAAASNAITAYPGKAGWNEAISQKVMWMVGATEQSATLTLNPKDLGPLQVVIQVNNEKADATFISENPEVRKALEEGMSNLRQLMSQAGVELGQANVNTNKEHQAFQQANKEAAARAGVTGDSSTTMESTVVNQRAISRSSQGLVDTFA